MIRQGEVDAFVVREAAEERIYSLRSADLLYRAMIEDMMVAQLPSTRPAWLSTATPTSPRW